MSASCKNTLSISSPKSNTMYEAAPDFSVAFTDGAVPSGLVFELNQKNVTTLFTVSSSGATAPASKLAAYLDEGDNRFSAKAGSSSSAVTFQLDTRGPEVRIASVKPGSTLEISGRLEDRAGVASLSVNGQSVPLTNNAFTVKTPDAPFVEFFAKDGMNHTSKTVYARPGATLASTAAARLNKSGLAFLIAELNAYLGTVDFNSIIKSFNPIFDMGDWYASARVDVTKVTMVAPKLTLTVSPSAARSFDVNVQIQNLVVDVHASGEILGIDWSANGKVWSSLAAFTGRTTVNINDTKLSVSISNLTCTLNGFGFDIAGFPDVLEQLFYDTVKDLLQDIIRDQLATRIPPLIEEFLKDIPSQFQFAFGDVIFEFAALPASLKTFAEGLTAHLGGWLETLTPAAGIPAALGSLYVNAAAPDLGTTTPGGVAYDLGAAMSVNLFNQGLLAAYQAGLLNLTLDGNNNRLISPEGFEDIHPELGPNGILDTLRFRIEPARPPFVRVLARESALASFGMHEFPFYLEGQGSDGKWVLVFGATIDMSVPFKVGVSADNKIQVTFEEIPAVKVYSVDDGGVISISPEFVQKTLDRLLPRALPHLAKILVEIPIPSIAGYSMQVKSLWAEGSEKAYLGLAGNLVKASVTAAAPEPTTAVSLEAEGYVAPGYFRELYPERTLRGDSFTVLLGGRDPEGEGLEFSYKLDDDPHWSVWEARSEIVLHDLLSGRHELLVRSRTSKLRVDPVPAKIVFATGFGEAMRGAVSVPAP